MPKLAYPQGCAQAYPQGARARKPLVAACGTSCYPQGTLGTLHEMGTQVSWDATARLLGATQAERRRIDRELGRIQRRLAKLEREAATLRVERLQLGERLQVLNLLARDPDMSQRTRAALAQEVGPGVLLRGVHIRELGVRVLMQTPRASRPIHYRDWYRLLTERGIRVSGRDPEASFLTQISRSPVVKRSTEQGVYYIDFNFPGWARQQLELKRAELTETFTSPASTMLADLDSAERHRTILAREIRHLERELREALRSLGTADMEPREAA